jgi:hypothetical protein
MISSSVAMSNPRIELACSSLSRTDRRGLNNLSRMSWSLAHRCRNTSMPRPPPSMALTSERSRTMIRASLCKLTALRNSKAASLRTIRPSHSRTAISPMLSIWIFSIFLSSFSRCCECTHSAIVYNLYFVWSKRLIIRTTESFLRGDREILGYSNCCICAHALTCSFFRLENR